MQGGLECRVLRGAAGCCGVLKGAAGCCWAAGASGILLFAAWNSCNACGACFVLRKRSFKSPVARLGRVRFIAYFFTNQKLHACRRFLLPSQGAYWRQTHIDHWKFFALLSSLSWGRKFRCARSFKHFLSCTFSTKIWCRRACWAAHTVENSWNQWRVSFPHRFTEAVFVSPFIDSCVTFSFRGGSYNGPKSKRATTPSMKMLWAEPSSKPCGGPLGGFKLTLAVLVKKGSRWHQH